MIKLAMFFSFFFIQDFRFKYFYFLGWPKQETKKKKNFFDFQYFI